MKLLILILLSTSITSFAQLPDMSDCRNLDSSSDANTQTKCASFFMLYQLALKNKHENLFEDQDLCINYDFDEVNNDFKISLVMNTEAFKTGVEKYNYEDPAVAQKYQNLKKTLNLFNQFFQSAKANPSIKVHSFADAQHNTIPFFEKNNPFSIIPGNKKFDTQSKVNNAHLAQLRGQNFVSQKFWPSNWPGKESVNPLHSPYGEDKLPDNKRNCGKRRSIMVEMGFNPFIDFKHKPGSYSPKFDMVTSDESKQMIAASALDGLSLLNKYGSVKDAVASLPESCQTSSSKKFLETAKSKTNNVTRLLNQGFPSGKSNKKIKKLMKKKFPDKKVDHYIFHQYFFASKEARETSKEVLKAEEDLSTYKKDPKSLEVLKRKERSLEKAKIKNKMAQKYSNYLKAIIDQGKNKGGNYSPILNDGESYDVLKSLVYESSNSHSIRGTLYTNLRTMFNQLAKNTFASKDIKQSTHGSDCFSSAAFYKDTFNKEDPKYVTKVRNLIDDNGQLAIEFDDKNMPFDSVHNKPGYFCSQCHSGIHFEKTDTGEYIEDFNSRMEQGSGGGLYQFGKPEFQKKFADHLASQGIDIPDGEDFNSFVARNYNQSFNGKKVIQDYIKNNYGISSGSKILNLLDSRATHEHLRSTEQNNSNLFKFGANKSLRLLLIPGCKFSEDGEGFDPDYVKKVAKPYAITKLPFNQDVAGIQKEDCFYKPKIMTACKVSPTGKGQNEGNDKPKQAIKFFNLDKMNMDELLVSETDDILNKLVESVGQLEIMCHEDGKEVPTLVSPENLVRSLSCKARNMSPPTASFNSVNDCKGNGSIIGSSEE